MGAMGRPSKHSPEVRERAVRMVFDHTPEHPSQWASIRSVGEKLGIRTESLRRWVRQAERDTGQRPGLTTSEREELKRIQRENVELKRPIAAVPRQSRRFDTEDRPDLARADFRHESLKSRSLNQTRPGTPQILVDDHHL